MAPKTDVIEQLRARIAELEEEKRVAELIAELEHIREQKNLLWFEFSIATQQLAAEQLNNKLLREALEFLNARIVTMDLGGVVERALSHPASTEALDNYVAEKVKDALYFPEATINLVPGEHYAGLVIGKDGEPSYHLVLLPGQADDITWDKAMEWAAKQGGEYVASLPTRREQPLLFANLKEEFEERAYWSCEAYESESGCAWSQSFYSGTQYNTNRYYELHARAVRRLPIQPFRDALTTHRDTSALDTYVAEKVKAIEAERDYHMSNAKHVYEQCSKITKQRDLAVEALHYCVKQVPELATVPGIATAIKESEAK